ncbi:long-chain-fatty-acid--CoA ligase [Bacillus sp. FJAT-47783]|uniref:long-chain-fatty-acid--CoA ligase n=1 Tax=Bacillus sp. FJAT-47783 TaxID=2922712 RepID=UPI001FADEBF5|nr:long-chain-fatty-acid--CoA ligase [Bacillus sp. FJAT-47783]
MEYKRPWYKHYPPEIPQEIYWEKKPLHQYLKNAAEEFTDQTAIYFLGKELTFHELYEQTLKMANYLQKLGVQKGDRVSIMLPNCPQAVIAYYAVLEVGGIVVQTNPLYTERELEYQMKDSGATLIVTLDLLFPKVSKVKALTNLEHIIVTSIKDYLPFPKNVLYPIVQKKQNNIVVQIEKSNDVHPWKHLLKTSEANELNIPINVEEDVAILQYTGGTTGFPKGVMLTHNNLASNTKMCSVWLHDCERGKESILGILPFFHVYGMTTVMNLSIMEGYKMILVPKFEVLDVLKVIDKQKPTLFPGAPTIYIGLLNHEQLKKYDLSSIKYCISGSAPLPVEIQQQFEKETGGKLVEGYGLSEASPVTHGNLLHSNNGKRGSIGIPWPNTDAGIYSFEKSEMAGPNELGEIIVKGPQVMKGYWNKPDETDAVIRDGWLYTGDVGYMDEDGYFYIVDRKKDMIIAGGFNIYPREIEEVLYEHEKIQEAVVAGVPDPYRGETVKAYVVLKDGVQITEEELDQFVRKHLAAFKVPKIYEFRKELPKTAVGKILRRQLVEEEKEKLKKVH